MGQDLPRPGNDGRGSRPLGSSCHHLRDERRELPPPRRTRTQARPRPPSRPRDNHGQRLIAAPRPPKPQFRLRDNHDTTLTPMPRHRIPILIAAPFPSRSPRYKPSPQVDYGSEIELYTMLSRSASFLAQFNVVFFLPTPPSLPQYAKGY